MSTGISTFLKNKMLDEFLGASDYTPPATVYLALFTTVPDVDGGGTEVSGGGYARKSITNNSTNFPNASGGSKTTGAAITFTAFTADVGDVVGWGIYDAASSGNLLCCGEFIGSGIVFTADASTDTLTASSHGLTNNQAVRVRNTNGNLPGGLSNDTKYYVINAATNTLQLSTSQGGSAVNITSTGDGTNRVHLDAFKTFNQNDVLNVPSGNISVALA